MRLVQHKHHNTVKPVIGVHQINILELDSIPMAINLIIDMKYRNATIYCDSNSVVAWVDKQLNDQTVQLNGL